MKLVLVLCAFVGLSKAFSVPNSTIFTNWEARIVGGSNAVLGQFPHQVSLRNLAAGNAHFCGGFIYSRRWIISAAHCTIGRTVASVRVVVGTISRTTGGTTYTTYQIINHPSYNPDTVAYDISLVNTAVAIAFNTYVKAIPLTITYSGIGNSAVVSGWGRTSETGPLADTLQYLNVQTLTNADCRNRHTASNAAKVFDYKICTSSPVNTGTCFGDSGGALVVNGAAVGVVSWGVGCGTSAPDVYERVFSHRLWIARTIPIQELDDILRELLKTLGNNLGL